MSGAEPSIESVHAGRSSTPGPPHGGGRRPASTAVLGTRVRAVGRSTGTYEAHELRDGDPDWFDGLGVTARWAT